MSLYRASPSVRPDRTAGCAEEDGAESIATGISARIVGVAKQPLKYNQSF